MRTVRAKKTASCYPAKLELFLDTNLFKGYTILETIGYICLILHIRVNVLAYPTMKVFLLLHTFL